MEGVNNTIDRREDARMGLRGRLCRLNFTDGKFRPVVSPVAIFRSTSESSEVGGFHRLR